MTNEKWNEAIAKEKKARADAVALLCRALQAAGVPLLDSKSHDRGRAMKYGTIYADPPWMERGGRQDQAGS